MKKGGVLSILYKDERSAWTLLAVGFGIIAFLKGVRLPNLWSATQLQLNYSFGFAKRAAVGALLHFLHIPIERYWIVVSFSFLVLATTVVLFVFFLKQKWRSPEIALHSTVFLSSFAVTYLVHLVGYLDIILLMMSLFVLMMPRNTFYIALNYIVCGAGLLIHETFLLSFFPAIWFRLFLEAMMERGPRQRNIVLHLVMLTALVSTEIVFIALPHWISLDRVSLMRATIGAGADFLIREDFFDVMTLSVFENVRVMMNKFQTPLWWVEEISAFSALLWVAVYFIWQSMRLIRASAIPQKTLVAGTAMGVSLCPILLQFLGWDLYRWYATAAFSAFIVYFLLVERINFSERLSPVTGGGKILAILLIGLNLSTGAGLLDDHHVNTFPFIQGVADLAREYKTLGYIPIPQH